MDKKQIVRILKAQWTELVTGQCKCLSLGNNCPCHLCLIDRLAEDEQNSHKHSVSGKRLTEIIHKAVDETYQTVDGYVNEYVDSTGDEMIAELNSLKDELVSRWSATAKGEERKE